MVLIYTLNRPLFLSKISLPLHVVTDNGTTRATGTVTFTIYSNPACSGAGTNAGTITLDSSGVAHPSDSAILTSNGLSFKAHYNGGNYAAVDSRCASISTSAAPTVLLFSSNTIPQAGAVLTTNLDKLNVQFNKPVWFDSQTEYDHSAANPVNYLLITPGTDGVFSEYQTDACSIGVQGNDLEIPINSVDYDPETFVATLHVSPLPDGLYTFIICGSTSIWDLENTTPLNGFQLGTTHGSDTILNFIISSSRSTTQGAAQKTKLPDTGFAPGRITALPKQPAEKAYHAFGDLTLEIPALKLKNSIVGVPETASGWDVTWLGNNAGWLNGTAFPTWNGNSVITGHVWDANNLPGIFVNLKQLKYDDQVKIHAWGQVYTYAVRETRTVAPSSLNAVLKHEDIAWLTLVTCEGFNPFSTQYSSRRIVRAVLVSVTAEK